MRNRTPIRWTQNRVLAVLLLLGFVSYALIPAGFMPGPGGLMICTGAAPAAASQATQTMNDDMSDMDMADMDMAGMDMAHHGTPPKRGGSPGHERLSVCPFAAAATSMASGHVAIAIAVPPAIARQIDFPFLPFVPRGTVVPTRLPRGPPALA